MEALTCGSIPLKRKLQPLPEETTLTLKILPAWSERIMVSVLIPETFCRTIPTCAIAMR
jgi:hypothetical protein